MFPFSIPCPRQCLLVLAVWTALLGVAPMPLSAQFPGVIEPFDSPDDLYLRANRVYDYGREVKDPHESRRALHTAIPLFREFLAAAPRHQLADKAWYRLGMSLLLTGQIEEAERVFDGVIKRYRTGQYVATSAYRLGAQRYNDSRWAEAAPFFGITAREADKAKLRHEALYYQARCLILAKDAKGAGRVLTTIIDDPGNPFVDYARLANGQLLAAGGRHEEALVEFEKLLTPATAPQERAQALLAAGVSASKMNNVELAEKYLFETLDTDGLDPKYKARAQLALMEMRFEDENWNAVVQIFQRGEFTGEPDVVAQIYMFGGRSLAKLDRHHEAIRLFFNVERLSPLSEIGFEASYRRLASFYHVNGPNIPAQADALVEIYGSKHPDHEWVQRAVLMKAETLFHRGRLAEAALAYNDVSTKNLPDDLLAGLYFKRGWSLADSGDYNRAAQNFTLFITRFPEDPRLLEALAKRGGAYLKLGDRSSALKDFDQLLASAPGETLAAFAHQNRGRIFREERKFEAMIDAYTTLLNEYRDLSKDTRGNCHYWIGWGWFKLDQWEQCLPHLEKARDLVPEFYKEPAGTHMVIAAYSLKDADHLKNAVTRLLSDVPGKRLPPKMLTWLGLQLFQKGDFDGADTFLTLASDPEEPADTDLIVWRHLAKARIELRHYDRAMDILPIVLEREDENFWRADACLDKAHALIGLEKWDEARAASHEGLQLDPHGTVRAGLNMSLGKIAMQREDYESAAASFRRTAELFVDDREIKPLALHLAAEALVALGHSGQATQVRDQLKREFPAWSPPEN